MKSILIWCCFALFVGLGGCGGSSYDYAARSHPPAGSNLPGKAETGPQHVDDQGFFYFSYDDSASLASADLAKYLLDRKTMPPENLGRPYEFLSAESFEHFNPESKDPFTVSMGIWPRVEAADAWSATVYELGVKVSGPVVDKETRKNLVLTVLLDVSGSMGDLYTGQQERTSLLDVAKHGLMTMHAQALKPGDVVHLITFSTDAQIVLEGWAFDGVSRTLADTLSQLKEGGSTNLNAGIELAYSVALRHYDVEKANRVLMLTDAYANTGEVNPEKIAKHVRINDAEGILFSGIGIGWNFNEIFLNQLTDAGKGAYFSMISPQDAQRVFSERFIALIDVAVRNVRFRLDYPLALKHRITAAEQISINPNQVQTTNFSFNSSQFFLEGFDVGEENAGALPVTLTIEYDDANGEASRVSFSKTVDELLVNSVPQIKDAFMVRTLAMLIGREMNCIDASAEVKQNLPDHSGPLAERYLRYIDDYCALAR